MPLTDTIKSGESFNYKWWKIEVQGLIFGTARVHFYIPATQLGFTVLSAMRDTGKFSMDQLTSFYNQFGSEASRLDYQVMETITVFKGGFSFWEKCRQAGKDHVDNVLGDGFEYIKRKNLLVPLHPFLK